MCPCTNKTVLTKPTGDPLVYDCKPLSLKYPTKNSRLGYLAEEPTKALQKTEPSLCGSSGQRDA